MAGGGALAALTPTLPAQQTREQLQQSVATNAIRLQAIGDRLRGHFRGGQTALKSLDFAHLVYAFARGIDYALSGGDVPKMASEIPDILRKVYQLKKDPLLQSSVMVLIISCKNACFNKWFRPADSNDILRMANEFSGNFCTPLSQPANDSTVLEIISAVMPRYYPQLKFERLVTSLEAKVGYDVLMADFFIHRNLPRNEKIMLIVVQKENLDASSCITSPPHVSFLVNGKGVDKRTNVSMETGPQFPTDITKMLKYGANIIQAVGYFNANYIIAVAFVNNLRSFDAPKLDDYAQPVTTDPPDSDILEGPSRVSLKCPISFRRIKTPIKGRLCKHYQCFDYDNYMEMNLRKPTWRCPCCNTPSNFIDLRIDQKMAKVLQETGDDIIDILVFPDGSWKAVSVHDEKSDRHAGEVIQQNGDTVETDATPDVIDLINGNDDGDLRMSLASASEDMKPLLNSQDLSVADYLPDLPISTTAQPEDLYAGGNNGCSNATSTSGQISLLPSTGGSGSSSFGTLESILPQDILRPVITDAVSPSLETSNSTFSMQHVLQGTHPGIVQLRSLIDPLPGSEVARPPIPRNIRREPVAVQALVAPPHNTGLSRRVQPNVYNCPPPIPQSNSASSTYQAHQVTNADSVITPLNIGVGPLSRAPDAASLMHLQSTQQVFEMPLLTVDEALEQLENVTCMRSGTRRRDMRNTSNYLHGRVMPPHLIGIRPPSGGPGQARGANAYGAPPMQQQQHFDQLLLSNLMSQLAQAPPPQTVEVPQVMPTQPGSTISPDIHSHLFSAQRSQALRLQAVPPRPAIPQTSPRLQPASLPPAAPTPSMPPHVGTSNDLPELPVEQNWRPTGQMRGSLTGAAYNQAIERYLNSAGQQTIQARPPGADARR